MSYWNSSRRFGRPRDLPPRDSPPRDPPTRDPPPRSPEEHFQALAPNTVALSMSVTSIYQDLQYVADNGEDVVATSDRARAHYLAQSGDFFRWFTNQGSAHLLVHGSYDQACHVSGLSLFCRSLFCVLDQDRMPHFIPLLFFCGVHTRLLNFAPQRRPPNYDVTISRDGSRLPMYDGRPSTGGRALIRNFLVQLLHNFPYDRIVMDPEELRDIEEEDLDGLQKLFSRLVGMLPPEFTLFCLVDGAEYYEQGGYWDDMGPVLDQLVKLSHPSNQGGSVRLLITTPTSTSHIVQRFHRRQCLVLDDLVFSSEILEQRLERLITQQA